MQATGTAGLTLIAATFVVAGVGLPMLLRTELWRGCLPACAPRRALLGVTASAFALNQLVGFRSGDLLRVALLRDRCGLLGATGSVALFRGVEVLALAPFAAVFAGALVADSSALHALAVVAVLGVAAMPFVARRLPPVRLLAPLAALRGPGAILLLAGSVCAHALEALTFVGVAQALGIELGWATACALLAASTLGQVIALLPANLGTYEASIAGALAALGHTGPALWQLPVAAHGVRLAVAAILIPFAMHHVASMRGVFRWRRTLS